MHDFVIVFELQSFAASAANEIVSISLERNY